MQATRLGPPPPPPASSCPTPRAPHPLHSPPPPQVDDDGCCLVVTTGGTGPAPRDVTPEATAAVCDRIMPGYGEQMRAVSLKHVPTAVLSRQTAGTRGAALILNLPGRPRAVRETIDAVFASVPACVDLLGGPYLETRPAVVAAYRPPNLVRTAKPPQE